MNSFGPRLRAQQAGGFTLLEVVIVLGMITILVTWLTVSIGTVETEERLRRATADITVMTKRARSIAVQQQRPYVLTISEGSIKIAPLYNISEDDKIPVDEEEPEQFQDIIDSEETDAEVRYEIRRWRSDIWQAIEDNKEVVLRLDPVGLVEPISIRCSVGKSWLIQDLHPLTAGVRDEQMNIEKE